MIYAVCTYLWNLALLPVIAVGLLWVAYCDARQERIDEREGR